MGRETGMSDSNQVRSCPECAGTNIDIETRLAPAICRDCGVVLDQKPEARPESEDSNQSEQEVEDTDQPKMKAIDWDDQIQVTDASDLRLISILNEMDDIASQLEVSVSARLRTAELVTEAWEDGLMQGRSQTGVIGACLLAACQQAGCPRPLRVVAEVMGTKPPRIFDTYRTLRSTLSLESETTCPRDYLPYLQKKIGLNDEVVAEAEQILKSDHEESGDPAGIAIAAVYIAANANEDQLTYVQAAELTGLTKETVWKKTKGLREAGAEALVERV